MGAQLEDLTCKDQKEKLNSYYFLGELSCKRKYDSHNFSKEFVFEQFCLEV